MREKAQADRNWSGSGGMRFECKADRTCDGVRVGSRVRRERRDNHNP